MKKGFILLAIIVLLGGLSCKKDDTGDARTLGQRTNEQAHSKLTDQEKRMEIVGRIDLASCKGCDTYRPFYLLRDTQTGTCYAIVFGDGRADMKTVEAEKCKSSSGSK